VIEIKNIVKTYGKLKAVDDVSFTVPDGQVLGFLGRNGAGKTTTMNIITGYISSTSGSVSINGVDILKNPKEAKQQIGYLPETPPLYNDMTVEEYLKFVCDLKKVPRAKMSDQLAYVYDMTKLEDVHKRLIANLSKGYRQRVGLAQALIGDPKVVIMDEPTVGLDPKQIIDIRNTIKNLGKKHTVILSSHILHEVSDVCQHVIIINSGKIVANNSIQNLTSYAGTQTRLKLRLKGTGDQIKTMFGPLNEIDSLQKLGCFESGTYDYMVQYENKLDLREQIFRSAVANGIVILENKTETLSLEDIFIQLTGDAQGGVS